MGADNNNGRTFMAIFIILIGVFGTITFMKLRQYPKAEDACCRSLTDPNNTYCYPCSEYKFHERVIYVWKYPPNTKDDSINSWFTTPKQTKSTKRY